MFTVDITGSNGVNAEFVIGSPVLALDLVLRAARAGFAWQIVHQDTGALALARLRELAAASASADDFEARCLQEIVSAEGRAALAIRN